MGEPLDSELLIPDVQGYGRRAVDENDPEALEQLLLVAEKSHKPVFRAVAALYLGNIDWDNQPVRVLSRLLADPHNVSLASQPRFTETMNSYKMFDGKVIGFGMAAATFATQNAGDVSAPIRKIAEVGLAARQKYPVGDADALSEIILTGEVPIDPDEDDPAVVDRERFEWRSLASVALSRLHTELDPELVAPLVALEAAWWSRGGSTSGTKNNAGFLLHRLQDHWTAAVMAEPIGHSSTGPRRVAAMNLTRLAKRGDEEARPYLERLTSDKKGEVARLARKGLKKLEKHRAEP